jgi:hypothetical protein
MRKAIFFYLLLIPLLSYAQDNTSNSIPSATINDGPYIFNVNDTFKVKWIENNVLKESGMNKKNYTAINRVFHLSCNYKDLKQKNSQNRDFNQNYKGADSIIAISDVHGRYNTYVNLLKANGVIDNDLNWKFGKGHFVFLGDAFDRGDMVTEILWHLFSLEKQAQKAGGRVHVLLGNHEAMMLNKDLRYIHEKYKKVESITGTKYFDLYSDNSELGKWLRSKPVIISINDILFVHAGISEKLIQQNLSINKINHLFSDSIIGKNIQSTCKSDLLKLLNGDDGPLWYRGYFKDTTFNENHLNAILSFYNKKQIVVGHTTYKEFKLLFDNKIIGIDNGIMLDQPGGVLIVKNNCFYKGLVTGDRIKL